MYRSFEDRDQASAAAAGIIENALRRRLEHEPAATLVLSGGSSPMETYDRLARSDIDWPRVNITLSDERWVPPSHEDSNERLLRDRLPVGAAANFVPLYANGETPETRSRVLDAELHRLPFPFACSLLGMGEDGHVASLFPDAATLAEGVDVDGDRLAVPVDTAASLHRRISLTLAALSRSDEVVLLCFGETKREVLDAAVRPDSGLPVSFLLMQKRAPVRVLWAP